MADRGERVKTRVYGRGASDRLSRADWIAAALAALARSGAPALNAKPLAAALGVSRGSFYWHFADVEALHRAVLAAWEEQATGLIIAIVEARKGSAARRLHRLAGIVFGGEGGLERKIRSWAAHDRAAAAAQARVDGRRLHYVATLFGATGCGPASARLRARILYLALIGQFAVGPREALKLDDVHAMIDLLLVGGEGGAIPRPRRPSHSPSPRDIEKQS